MARDHVLTVDAGANGAGAALFTLDGSFVAGALIEGRDPSGRDGASEPCGAWPAILGAARSVVESVAPERVAVVVVVDGDLEVMARFTGRGPGAGETTVTGALTGEVAERLGLGTGTVVVHADARQAAAVGAGAVAPFEGHIHLGVAAWLGCHVPRRNPGTRRGVACRPSPLPGLSYLCDEAVPAAACLDWLRDEVLFPDDELRDAASGAGLHQQVEGLAASAPPGSRGVVFVPWRASGPVGARRGGWHNLSLSTARADMARSVLEGVAFEARRQLERVERSAGRPCRDLSVSGGGAGSALWASIVAGVIGRPVRRVADPSRVVGRGAALLAAAALGHSTAGVPASAPGEVLQPDPAHRHVYDDLYRAFGRFRDQRHRIYRKQHRHG